MLPTVTHLWNGERVSPNLYILFFNYHILHVDFMIRSVASSTMLWIWFYFKETYV